MQWVKHDTNANQDAKLKKVRMKYGLEGYGLYWYCIELIAADIDQNNLTFELEHDAEIISYDTGIHVERVNEMMAYMVNVGLFESSGDAITCLKLLKRLDQSMTSNKQMRELIVKAKANHDSVMISHDSVMQEEKRREENKTLSDHQDDHRAQIDIEEVIDSTKPEYPHKLTLDFLDFVSNHWCTEMLNISPAVYLSKHSQINKKRWAKINKIIKDHPEFSDHEYFLGYFSRLATHPDFQWQRENRQLTFDQAMQLDKFERNLDLMRMGEDQ